MKHHLLTILGLFLSIGLLSACEQHNENEQHEPTKETNQPSVVTLSKESLEHIDLKVAPASLTNLGMTLKAAGRLSLDLNKTAKISSTLEGRLARLNVDINDSVKKGDVLASVESPELLGKELQIKSPINGVITARLSTVGELVDKSKEILTVSDLSNLWVIAEIKERDIASVKVGQPATFRVLSFPDKEFRGQVLLTGNQVEEDSRTLEIRIGVENLSGLLKPGMFADVAIVTTLLENVLAIPDSALQTDGENQVVFIALDENRFEKRVVRVGFEQEGTVQIIEGVSPGDKVVTEGSFVLKSELLKGELGEE